MTKLRKYLFDLYCIMSYQEFNLELRNPGNLVKQRDEKLESLLEDVQLTFQAWTI